ncbi:glycosyltransferase [Desulfotomaculum sp. 1211_IL3151]|uniref:glycosyltransferase n=1 Tax=Desulfotomaculum sp. 1211_IL3151 TaxID=3084055 RepID=UPI002FD93D74
MKKRVLIGSPIKQKKAILQEFLHSLEKLERRGLQLDFVFIDDNNDHNLLEQFARKRDHVLILKNDGKDLYVCDEKTHQWNEQLIWKVASFKNTFIDMAIKEGYDYLFLVDSDLYLQPKTIRHLVSLNKDIVSEVFWTTWEPELAPMPQVWVADQYKLFDSKRGEPLDEEEVKKRMMAFIELLQRPGTYKVGGLGACTLISRQALLKGVSFNEIYNISLWGEDRHFCVRAAALGLELYADTFYPPFHIYRESELAELKMYKRKMGLIRKKKQSQKDTGQGKGDKITLAMLVRNESGRFLAQVLAQARQYIDNAVILDDASEDNTIEECKQALEGIPLTVVSNPVSGFDNEVSLRKQLWQMAVGTKPDWILILDADEVFEASAPAILKNLAKRKDVYWYSFRLFDMWTERHYREDRHWCAHQFFRPLMVRYIPGHDYRWHEAPLHCGRFPLNISGMNGENHPLRIKHLGWLKPEDRLAKYYRYKKLDPQSRYGIAEQYESILDPCPNLVEWVEEKQR